MLAKREALLILVTYLLALGIPKVTEVLGIWMERWRDRVKNEVPDVWVEIENVVATHDSVVVTERANRLRESAKG